MCCCWSLQVIKCIVILLNIFYCLTGIAIFITGIYISTSTLGGAYAEILPGISYLNTSYLLIVIGIFIVVTSVLGCISTFRDTKCCILSFYFLVVFVICLEVSVIILGYVGNGKLRTTIDDYSTQEMLKDIRNYAENEDFRKAWDQIQTEERCCGVRRSSDWYNRVYGERPFVAGQTPDSCCVHETEGCGQLLTTVRYPEACGDILLDVIHKGLGTIATVALIFVIFQIVLVLFIICWYYMLHYNKNIHWCCSCCVYTMMEIEDDEKDLKN